MTTASLSDGLSLMSLLKDLMTPSAALGAPTVPVGQPGGPGYVVMPNGAQDVVDATLFVPTLPEVGDAAVEDAPLSDSEINMIFGGLNGLGDRFGAIDFAGGFREAFGGPEMRALRVAHPDLAGYGGPLDAVANFFTSASEKTLGALGAATKGAISALSKAQAATNARLATVEKNQKNVNTNTTRRLGALENTVRQLSQKWNQHNGQGSMYKRIILTVAQSWPGIKANRTIHDPSLVSFFAIQKRFFASMEAKITLSDATPINAAGAAYVQADVNTIISQITANLDDVRADNAAMAAILNELIGGVIADEASKKSAATFHSYISNRSMLDQIAELLPASLENQTEAMWQAGVKYLGPKPAAAGTGIFGSLGL